MAAFNEMRTPTSRRYNYAKVFRRAIAYLIALLCFCFRKIALKMLNFVIFFTSKITFRGYCQWNGWSHFQKIRNWTRYCDAKFMTSTSIFFVALLHFCFKKRLRILNLWICLPLKESLVATFNETCALTSRKHVSKSGMIIPNFIGQIFFLVALLYFCFRKVA